MILSSSILAQSPVTGVLPSNIKPYVSQAAESYVVLAARPASLVNLTIWDSATEYILIVDKSSLPSNGTVTLLHVPIKVSADTTVQVPFRIPYGKSTSGIVVINSSTAPSLTKGGNTVMYSSQIQ